MLKKLEIIEVTQPAGMMWDEFYRIYTQAFPRWKRESEIVVTERVASRRYYLGLGRIGDEVVGMYLLDVVPNPQYVFFSNLAVDKSWQGQGFGTALCLHAMNQLNTLPGYGWLFIEAEDRLLNYYVRLGFRKLELEYLIPHFDGPDSIPMHLLVMSKDSSVTEIQKHELHHMIVHLFTDGYQLTHNDPRLIEQCKKIKNKVKLSK